MAAAGLIYMIVMSLKWIHPNYHNYKTIFLANVELCYIVINDYKDHPLLFYIYSLLLFPIYSLNSLQQMTSYIIIIRINGCFLFLAGLILQSQGTPLDSCRVAPFINLPSVREPIDRVHFPPFIPYYPFHAAAAAAAHHPIHPMFLYPHHYAAAFNYATLHESSFKGTKNSSIADLRLKARQHLATLGL